MISIGGSLSPSGKDSIEHQTFKIGQHLVKIERNLDQTSGPLPHVTVVGKLGEMKIK